MRKSLLLILSVAAMAVVLCSAGKRQKHLFMVGDSTMADKTELEISPERGWGQLFPTYLTDKIVVENHAMNGRSTKSFQDEGRWAEVLKRMQKGDILILQFGHNDAKVTDPARYASVEQYEKNLVKMGREAQQKGVSVILCTPISRRHFSDEGEFQYKHAGYPSAAWRAARSLNVPLLDMESATAEWLKKLGDEPSRKYFMNVAPGECTKFPEGKIDNTHLREAGALIIGQMAVDLLREQNVKCLTKYLREEPSKEPVYTVFCRPF